MYNKYTSLFIGSQCRKQRNQIGLQILEFNNFCKFSQLTGSRTTNHWCIIATQTAEHSDKTYEQQNVSANVSVQLKNKSRRKLPTDCFRFNILFQVNPSSLFSLLSLKLQPYGGTEMHTFIHKWHRFLWDRYHIKKLKIPSFHIRN